ncbi:hypothetical protein MINTMi27_15660 [Mycobacterium intracellulare]|uniref:hypothetical protein n=1 Tax=Mycobacterium intracellulare TaxID=1767 RepID=UPI001925DB8F|nr:hypothetical protein [Mycobacterium intracellulare]BCP41473.1 hypothetical protein MINTMi27_15660 [Mycobacterium intracellulare]
MTALFPIDQEQNDQLLLQEAQRKQDLIDFAVRRFAPHLEGKPDVKVIHLYSTNASLRKEIRALCGGKTILVEHVVDGTERKDRNEVVQEGVMLELPSRADYVATKSALNTKVEWLSARLQALPLVLPEATDYLLAALDRKGVITVVGGDQAR